MSLSSVSPSPSSELPTATSTTPIGLNPGGNSLGTATYYGAVAVVVFVLLVITFISRIMFRRRVARLAATRQEQYRLREEEERNGMVRRGEEAGLPTYRQSAYDLMSSSPHVDLPGGGITAPLVVPPQAHLTSSSVEESVAPPPYRPQPPKYEDDDLEEEEGGGRRRGGETSTELGRGGQAVDAADVVEMVEMRQHVVEPTLNAPPPPPPPPITTTTTTITITSPDEDAQDDMATYEQRTRTHDIVGRPHVSQPTPTDRADSNLPPLSIPSPSSHSNHTRLLSRLRNAAWGHSSTSSTSSTSHSPV